MIQTLRFGWFFGIQVFMGVAAGVVASVGAGPILFLPMFTIVHIVWCLSLLSWGAPTYFRRILSFGVRPSVTVVPTHAEGLLLFAAPAVTLTTLGAAILQLPVDYVFAVGLVELFGAFTILATGGRHLLVRP